MPSATSCADALAHALGELAGGLAREGEPEHLGHADVPVGEQPDDPVRHRLGLAAARAGDDDARAVRIGLDHRAAARRWARAGRARDGDLAVASDAAHADTAGTRCTRYCQAPKRERKPSSPGPSNSLPDIVRADRSESLAERRLGLVVERLLRALGERRAPRTGLAR